MKIKVTYIMDYEDREDEREIDHLNMYIPTAQEFEEKYCEITCGSVERIIEVEKN